MTMGVLKMNECLSRRDVCGIVATALLAFLSAAAAQSEYVPYPGRIEVKVSRVETPKVVRVRFETWPGFYRDFRVTLPGISVPKDSPGVQECERELGRKAMAFTQRFVTKAKAVYVVNMRMQDSSVKDGVARIDTSRGDLIEALQVEGLARPDDINTGEPWC
jgi:endonuclease YncB( thermonuclease family)